MGSVRWNANTFHAATSAVICGTPAPASSSTATMGKKITGGTGRHQPTRVPIRMPSTPAAAPSQRPTTSSGINGARKLAAIRAAGTTAMNMRPLLATIRHAARCLRPGRRSE